jgi:hypothetical protein
LKSGLEIWNQTKRKQYSLRPQNIKSRRHNICLR